LLAWAKRPGEKAATWANDAYLEVPGLGDDGGVWVNQDSYIPDVPSLDPEIFTSQIKPYFKYYEPPLANYSKYSAAAGDEEQGVTKRKVPINVFKHVEPSAAVTQAIKNVALPNPVTNPTSVIPEEQPSTSKGSTSNRFIPSNMVE
jgi:hypothetical protein